MTDVLKDPVDNAPEYCYETRRTVMDRVRSAASSIGALITDKLNPKSGYVEVYDPRTVTREYRAKRNIFGRIATRQ